MDATLYILGAVIGLAGAVVGATAGFLGTYLQQRQQNRRDRLRMAVEVGLQDYKQDLELARSRPGSVIAPPEVYVWYHMKMLDAITKGELTPEMVKALKVERDIIYGAFG